MSDRFKVGDVVYNNLSDITGTIKYLYENGVSGKMALVDFDEGIYPVSLKYISDATKPIFKIGDILSDGIKDYIIIGIDSSEYKILATETAINLPFKDVHKNYGKTGELE